MAKKAWLTVWLAVSVLFGACSSSLVRMPADADTCAESVEESVFQSGEPDETLSDETANEPITVTEITAQTTALPETAKTTEATYGTTKATSVMTKVTSGTTTAPVTQSPPPASFDIIYVGGKTIGLGGSADNLTSALGKPERTDATRSAYRFYIYSADSRKLFFAAVYSGQVVGFFTNAYDFSFCGINKSSDVNGVNAAFGGGAGLNGGFYLDYSREGYDIRVYFDTIGTGKVSGISVVRSGFTQSAPSEAVCSCFAREMFDLTNSFRAQNNKTALSWSDQAASAALGHSVEMVSYNYFAHNSYDGTSFSDRLKNAGITYRVCSENIAADFGDAVYAMYGLYNSSGHRNNMLYDDYRFVGCGVAYLGDGVSPNLCYTQDFYVGFD